MSKILVVDEAPATRARCRLELEDAGHTVRTAADPREAWNLVRTWVPDLVILDVQLGAESGLDLLRRVVEALPGVRTVIATAHPGYRDDFASWLADAYLEKSGDLTELLATVRELVAAEPAHAVGSAS